MTHTSTISEDVIKNDIAKICNDYTRHHPQKSLLHKSHKHVSELQRSIDTLTTLEAYKQENDPSIKSAALIYQLFLCAERLRLRGFKKNFPINYVNPLGIFFNTAHILGYTVMSLDYKEAKQTAISRTIVLDKGEFRCAVENLLGLYVFGKEHLYSAPLDPRAPGYGTCDEIIATKMELLKKFPIIKRHYRQHPLFNLNPKVIESKSSRSHVDGLELSSLTPGRLGG